MNEEICFFYMIIRIFEPEMDKNLSMNHYLTELVAA